MTESSNYPDITYESVFKIYTIKENLKKDKLYLEKSPYSDTIKKSLALILAAVPEKISTDGPINTSDLDIKTEAEELYRQTKEILNSRELDDKDKASVLKTSTALLEKLLNILERSENIQYMREFETKVLLILKKVAPEKREEFLKELETSNETRR